MDGADQTPGTITRLFQWLKKTLGGMVTEHNGVTHDFIKHGGWIGLLAVLSHDYYQLSHGVNTNVKDLAISIGTVLGAVGIGVGAKRNSEQD